MRPHRRTPLAPICFVGILLAGTTLADDDMHNKNAMPSPIGQQPTSTPSAHAMKPTPPSCRQVTRSIAGVSCSAKLPWTATVDPPRGTVAGVSYTLGTRRPAER